MKKIAIIGAGNLGSRHLQGLKDLTVPSKIYVVDPYEESLEMCRQRWMDTGAKQHEIVYFTSIPSHISIDCAILSATADVRAQNTIELVQKNVVKNIIFEKFLFQKTADYHHISILLKEKNISAWVNCPRRVWPAYPQYKTLLGKNPVIHLQVSGYPWGLGCNSIHMMDLAAYLCGSTDYKIENIDLDTETIPSKREGFVEFTGRFSGKFSNGSTFLIEALKETSVPYTLTLKSEKSSMIYHEDLGYYELFTSGQWKKHDAPLPYQSQMTGKIIEEILQKGTCVLTTYEDSAKLHLPLLDMCINHLVQTKAWKGEICPIT